jgi:hypothetical protein
LAASHSQDSLILQRCLFHHQISIQLLLHQLRKEGYCKVCENKLKKVVQKYDCTGIEEDEGQTWQQVDGIDMHGLSTV